MSRDTPTPPTEAMSELSADLRLQLRHVRTDVQFVPTAPPPGAPVTHTD